MDKYSQIAELCKIYREMDTEGRNKVVTAATQLFCIQKTLENGELPARDAIHTTTFYQKSPQASRFNGAMGYFIIGFLLFFSACFFWITLINPALLILGNDPLIMLRIIITAIFGMFIIGAGLVRFLMRKFSVLWMLLAIGAGILCVDPAILTDLIGFGIIALIIAVQVICWKREKETVAV